MRLGIRGNLSIADPPSAWQHRVCPILTSLHQRSVTDPCPECVYPHPCIEHARKDPISIVPDPPFFRKAGAIVHTDLTLPLQAFAFERLAPLRF